MPLAIHSEWGLHRLRGAPNAAQMPASHWFLSECDKTRHSIHLLLRLNLSEDSAMSRKPTLSGADRGTCAADSAQRGCARDGRLDQVARLAACLAGVDAALVWLTPSDGQAGGWGGAGRAGAWAQASACIAALSRQPAGQPDPGGAPQLIDLPEGETCHVRQATIGDPDGQPMGGLAVLGEGNAPLPPDAGPLLDRLGRWLAQALVPGAPAGPGGWPDAARGAALMAALQVTAWRYDASTRALQLGTGATAVLGLAQGQAPTILDGLRPLLSEDAARRLQRAVDTCLGTGQPIDEEIQLAAGESPRRWLRWVGVAIRDATGGVGAIQGALQDISSRKQAQEETLRLAMRLTTTLASITEAFVTLDRAGRFMYVNGESERLLGASTRQLLDEPIWQQLQGQQPDLVRARIDEALSHNQRVEFEDFYPTQGKWIELRAYPYAEGLAVYFRDVSERKAAEEKIHRLAFYDPLTGLPNRQLLIERLETALLDCAANGHSGALMFIDLDNFKVLNDTRGHHTGDLLLKGVATRLRHCVRVDDTVARIGGDEFVVLLQALDSDPAVAARKAHAVATKVLARMIERFDLDGHQHHCTTSIGITLIAAGQDNVAELLQQADMAMYQAKHMGRNTLAFFDPPMQAALNASASLALALRAALSDDRQLTLHYQPQFDRARRITGVEALLRWQHPQRGLVGPVEFIPVAEDTGLIVPLGLWALTQACRQLACWQGQARTAALSISVNVSARQFRHPDFVDQVTAVIRQCGAPPRRLRLELTESLLADHLDITLAQMARLRQLGVALSLDDFGTGYSSLAYLKRLPLDQIKIDRAFVADVLSDAGDAAIAGAIIGMAHSMGLKVVAEGVETEAQHRFLSERGCDQFQGFLLAPPLPLEALEAFIALHATA